MFVKFKELRTATNAIIINLAFTDIGVAGIGYPLSAASDLHGSWKFGYTGCQVGGISFLDYFQCNQIQMQTHIVSCYNDTKLHSFVNNYLVELRHFRSAMWHKLLVQV